MGNPVQRTFHLHELIRVTDASMPLLRHILVLNGAPDLSIETLAERDATAIRILENLTKPLDERVEALQLVLDAGANPNGFDEKVRFLITKATKTRHAGLVRVLLEANAFPDVNAYTDDAPLIYASNHEDYDIINLLIAADADVNVQNATGVTALASAALWGSAEVVRILLAAGADVNKATNDGDTALTLACRRLNLEIVEMLLRVDGIDVSHANEEGRTARSLLRRRAGTHNLIRLIDQLSN